MFLSQGYLIPCPLCCFPYGPFSNIDPILVSCGASLLVGQVLRGLLTWLVFAAIPAAGCEESSLGSNWSPALSELLHAPQSLYVADSAELEKGNGSQHNWKLDPIGKHQQVNTEHTKDECSTIIKNSHEEINHYGLQKNLEGASKRMDTDVWRPRVCTWTAVLSPRNLLPVGPVFSVFFRGFSSHTCP